MANNYAAVYPGFWTGETGKKIKGYGRDCQVLALYLLTNSLKNAIGLYYIPKVLISHETGIPFQGSSKGMEKLAEGSFLAYDNSSEVIWIYEMANFQVGKALKITDKRVKFVNKLFNEVPNNPFLFDFLEKYGEAYHLEPTRKISPFEGVEKIKITPSKPIQYNTDTNTNTITNTDTLPKKEKIPFKKIIDRMNEILVSVLKNPYEMSDPIKRKIKILWNAGHREIDFETVVTTKLTNWQGTKFEEFLRPSTLFKNGKFQEYLNEKPKNRRAEAILGKDAHKEIAINDKLKELGYNV